MTDDRSGNAFREFLEQEGINAKQFAAFINNFIGADPEEVSGDDNVPGFEYLSRVSSAASRAVIAHTKAANNAWSEMRYGRYGIGTAMKSWVRVVENYYGVATEMARMSPARGPVWQVIPYSRANPKTFYSIRVDEVLQNNDNLVVTPFTALGTGSGRDDVLIKPPHSTGTRIEFDLDKRTVEYMDNGNYLGVIFRQGAGATSPLVVLVLRVGA